MQIYKKKTDTSPPTNRMIDSDCVKTCQFDKSAFPRQPHCYALDKYLPDQNQVCAYEANGGGLVMTPGCCDTICPSLQCPNELQREPEMERQQPIQSPLQRLLMIVCIIIAILLVSAGILASASK